MGSPYELREWREGDSWGRAYLGVFGWIGGGRGMASPLRDGRGMSVEGGCPLGGVPLGVVAFSGRGEALDGDLLAALLDLPQIVGHLHAEPSFGC